MHSYTWSLFRSALREHWFRYTLATSKAHLKSHLRLPTWICPRATMLHIEQALKRGWCFSGFRRDKTQLCRSSWIDFYSVWTRDKIMHTGYFIRIYNKLNYIKKKYRWQLEHFGDLFRPKESDWKDTPNTESHFTCNQWSLMIWTSICRRWVETSEGIATAYTMRYWQWLWL